MDTAGSTALPGETGLRGWRALTPQRWGIATRSAAVSATVVLVALTIAAAGLLTLLEGSLLSGVDDAARARVTEIVAALQKNPPAALDDNLLATNQRISAIQILNDQNHVVKHSSGASTSPLGTAGTTAGPASPPVADGMRITGESAMTRNGRYVVLVGGATDAAFDSVKTVGLLLAVTAPLVMGETALVSYLLTKRSLSSVDAIRSRVAEISTSDLSERVPVPPSGDEIASLAVTMNEMLDRIERGHLAQRQFVGDASHELRSPLTTILSALEVVEAHPHLLDHALISGTLLPEADRMKILVEDLLLLARADEATLMPRRDVVHLDQLVDDETARIRNASALDVRTDIGPTMLIGDGSGLSRMLRNLLDNAARHAHTQVEVIAYERAGQTVVEVADDGQGIPAADRKRVFDRFVRLETDRSRRSGGTGLGLAIVAEIVAAHDGTVAVSEREGGGALVRVVLPSGQ